MKYYVYKHVDPITAEIVYVGFGSRDRAWKFPPFNPKYPSANRSPAHIEWMEINSHKGFWPGDWVVLVEKNLDKDDALKIEKSLIKSLNPRFNRMSNFRSSPKLLKEIREMQELRNQGETFQSIAKKFGVTRQTAARYISEISRPKEEYKN